MSVASVGRRGTREAEEREESGEGKVKGGFVLTGIGYNPNQLDCFHPTHPPQILRN